jgi:hypothetical protein
VITGFIRLTESTCLGAKWSPYLVVQTCGGMQHTISGSNALAKNNKYSKVGSTLLPPPSYDHIYAFKVKMWIRICSKRVVAIVIFVTAREICPRLLKYGRRIFNNERDSCLSYYYFLFKSLSLVWPDVPHRNCKTNSIGNYCSLARGASYFYIGI